jgi:hypothetical protein
MSPQQKLYPFTIPLTGKLITSADGTELPEGSFQVLTNLRYGLITPKSVAGMTKINTSVINATYLKPRAGHQFIQHTRTSTVSHVMVQAWNVGDTASKVYENIATVPAQGNFVATEIWSDTQFSQIGKFSDAPDGSVAYVNGMESCIWGGYECRVPAFIVASDDLTTSYDYTKQVNDKNWIGDTYAVMKQDTLYIGSIRPIKGVKFYILTANASACVPVVHYWAAGAWVDVPATLSDTTTTAGASLAKDGIISFGTTVDLAKPRIIQNKYLYWYKFTFTGVDVATSIYYVTLDAPFQKIVDLWGGEPIPISSFWAYVDGTGWLDRTTQVFKEDYVKWSASSDDTLTYTNIGTFTTSSYVIAGFEERMAGINFKLVNEKINSTASVATVYYWNGTAWVTVGTISDGTSVGGVSLARSGWITWDPPEATSEFKYALDTNAQLFYYYKIVFNDTLSTNVYVDLVTGITAQKTIPGYRCAVMWADSLWLLNEHLDKKNSAIASQPDTICVFNGVNAIGTESPMIFGDNDDITCAATLYTRFGTDIFDNLVVFKNREAWIVNAIQGADNTGLSRYQKFMISENYGCPCPNTLKTCDTGYELAPGLLKHILIWRAENAICIFDGNSVQPISDDIQNYLDKNKSEYIDPSSSEHGFYDPTLFEYHWITSAKEFVYDIRKKKWFEIDRESSGGVDNQIRIGFTVTDSNGSFYTYGGLDAGYIERLENGNTFDGASIVSTFRVPDISLGSWQYETKIRYIKHIAIKKSTTTNKVTMTHYKDTSTAGDHTATFTVNSTTKRVVFENKSVDWGDCIFHGIQCSITTTNESCGYEPVGISGFFEKIRESN